MIGIEEMRAGTKKVIVSVVIIVVLFLAALSFILPDHDWEICKDVDVGDYYILLSERYERTSYVTEVSGDDLTVQVTTRDMITGDISSDYFSMTEDEFLKRVLFTNKNTAEYIGSIFLNTYYGTKFCNVYVLSMNKYYVDEYGVIYDSAIGGVFWSLAETSLFYGNNESEYVPINSTTGAVS